MDIKWALTGEAPHRFLYVSYRGETPGNLHSLAVVECSEISYKPGLVGHFYINRIIVPPQMRNQGVGTTLMNFLLVAAEEHKLTFYVDPTSNYGSEVTRLTRFFARFGFVTSTNKEPLGKMVRRV